MLRRFVLVLACTMTTAHAGVIEKAAALPEPGTLALTIAGVVLIVGLALGKK